jgi:hypothetical protein
MTVARRLNQDNAAERRPFGSTRREVAAIGPGAWYIE